MTVSAPAKPQSDLGMLLWGVTHALKTRLTAALEEIGVTPRVHCVLANAASGEYTQSQLAEMSQLDKTTMVVTTDLLERRGLAERRPVPDDRRVRIIKPTPAGLELVERAQRVVERVYADVLGSLPEDERTAFMSALQRLAGGPLCTPAECEHPPRRPRAV